MIDTQDIRKATTLAGLYELLEAAAQERNCELYEGTAYADQADFLLYEANKLGGNTNMESLAELLFEAEDKCNEIRKSSI